MIVSHTEPTETKTETEQETHPFNRVSDIETTRSQQYRRQLDEYVVAPIRVLLNDRRGLVGSVILLFFLLMGTVGVQIVPRPEILEGPQLYPALQDPAFPLGTDMSGRDILGMIVHATPAMLKMISGGAVFSISVATIWGVVSGFKGGTIDTGLMSIADVLMTIPGLPLVILIAAIFEPRNPFVVGILLSVHGWAGLARAIRSQVLTVREESYVEASRTMGISTIHILSKDIIPNLMPYIVVNFVMRARGIIFASVGLYFLGILPSSTLNWGVMLNEAYSAGGVMTSLKAAHWFLVPMLTIILMSMGLILFGQAADQLFNPRIRARHAKTSDDEVPVRQ